MRPYFQWWPHQIVAHKGCAHYSRQMGIRLLVSHCLLFCLLPYPVISIWQSSLKMIFRWKLGSRVIASRNFRLQGVVVQELMQAFVEQSWVCREFIKPSFLAMLPGDLGDMLIPVIADTFWHIFWRLTRPLVSFKVSANAETLTSDVAVGLGPFLLASVDTEFRHFQMVRATVESEISLPKVASNRAATKQFLDNALSWGCSFSTSKNILIIACLSSEEKLFLRRRWPWFSSMTDNAAECFFFYIDKCHSTFSSYSWINPGHSKLFNPGHRCRVMLP